MTETSADNLTATLLVTQDHPPKLLLDSEPSGTARVKHDFLFKDTKFKYHYVMVNNLGTMQTGFRVFWEVLGQPTQAEW